MAKILISTSAANPFISADGLVDVVAIGRLAGKVQTSNKKSADALKAAAPSPAKVKVPKSITPIFYTRKELVKYTASLEKKNDHKYKTLRGQQIKSRTKMPSVESNVKIKVLLPALFETDNKALVAEVKKAVTAITMHNRKAEKVVDKVKTEKTKIRDQQNAEFDKNVDELVDILIQGGIKEANIVVGQSMFGKVVHVKLPGGGVISVGKSDVERMRAAKKTQTAKE